MPRTLKLTGFSLLATLAGISASGGVAHADKTINFTTTGSVTSTLIFTNQVVPDVYTFFAVAGEQVRLQTSNNGFDTTLRVVGPDASINLFDDDGAGGLASRLTFTAADSGEYVVIVSSFSGNPTRTGNYTLSFARGASALQPLAIGAEQPDEGVSSPEVSNPVEQKP